ncbi:MAG TPA: hypothetical protein VMT67_16810 [Terriglobales bacterium]|nr:hypothetical protein [Terriglobales bacterium]
MTVVFLLLVVIAMLLYVRRPNYTFSVAVLIAALTWLAIDVHLLRLVQEMVAFVVENWADVAMGVGAVIVLIVPAMMIYIGVRDEIDKRATHPHQMFTPVGIANARNRVLDKFERRVATLLALGYSRTEAEATAFHQMKRDLGQGAAVGHDSRRT